ncbi:RIPP1 protein, partial [Dromaius novaehollandiae]|nr:RIPP1 protein [Dromaius novaehollandiae]
RRALPLWRPWLPRDEEASGPQMHTVSVTLPAGSPFSHHRDRGPRGRLSPRRLLWPRSKSFDYLYSVGERLLHSFPVQATLCLYDDSDSEEEEDDEEEEEE